MTKRDTGLLTLAYVLRLFAAYLLNVFATGAHTPQEIFSAWIRFDGIYFRVIAEHGYAEASQIIRYQQGFPFLTAAFPLFPLLIRTAAPLFGGDYAMASVIVPQMLTWLAVLSLFRLVTLDFSRRVAYLSVLSLLAFPTFHFLLAPYSETLFLWLAILTFYFYRQPRPWIAGLTGALASATRIVGAPLLAGALGLDAAYKAWQQRHRRRDVLRPTNYSYLFPIPLGLAGYMLYQWWDFGSPLIFLRGHASSEWKVGFDLLGPLRGVLLPFYTLVARDWSSDAFRSNLFNSLFLYVALGIALYAWHKLPLSYSLYGVLAVALPTFTGSLISMPRFVLISFPLFIAMGLLFDAHPRLRLWLIALALSSLLSTYLFFRTVFLG
jgi:hypothetical protein